MNKDIVKKQHYVPRFYLNKFTLENSPNANKNKVLVYDKVNRKTYHSNVYDIAYEKYFYDLDEDKENRQVLEKAFSTLETSFSKEINNLISICEYNKNNPNALILRTGERKKFAYQMAMQLIRTKKYRIILKNLHSDITSKRIEFIKRLENITDDIDFTVNEKLIHLRMLIDEDFIFALTNVLYNSYWVILYNNTNIPFITSDNPICRIPRISSNEYYQGVTTFFSPDLEINFPITPYICIRIMGEENPNIEKFKKYKNKLVITSNENLIDRINIFQYIMANERVFLINNDIGKNIIEKLSRIDISMFGSKIF